MELTWLALARWRVVAEAQPDPNLFGNDANGALEITRVDNAATDKCVHR